MMPVSAAISIVLLLAFVGLIVAGVFSLLLITLLLFSLIFAVSALLSLLGLVRFSRDLREGRKRLINAPIEDQNLDVRSGGRYTSASYNYWVKAGGRKLSITEQQYYQLKKGDLIQAYVAPYSGTVLGISGGDLGQPGAAQAPMFGQSYQAEENLAKQGSRKMTRMVVTVVIVLVAGIVVVGAVGAVVLNMSEKTYNSFNPFAPKPPQGAFPESIAGLKQTDLFYNDGRSYGAGYEFNSTYGSSGTSVYYRLIDFGSPSKVAERLKSRYYFSADIKVIGQSDTETVATTPTGGAVILLAAGSRLVYLSGRAKDVRTFLDELPYAALGIAKPATPSLAQTNVTPISVPELVATFQADKNAAFEKYDGKTFLFTGTIKNNKPLELSGKLLISIQKVSGADPRSDSVTAEFPVSEKDNLSRLKIGDTANFRCRVFAYEDTKNFDMLEDCSLQ